jgi:hypothetical protein
MIKDCYEPAQRGEWTPEMCDEVKGEMLKQIGRLALGDNGWIVTVLGFGVSAVDALRRALVAPSLAPAPAERVSARGPKVAGRHVWEGAKCVAHDACEARPRPRKPRQTEIPGASGGGSTP